MSDEKNIDWENLEDDPMTAPDDGGSDVNSDTGRNGEESRARSANELDAVFDVPVNVSAVLGKAYLEVSQLMKLGPGTIVELDRKVGEAIDIFVNNRLVARGEVVVIDERLGVTMTEIIKGERG
ncbi:MAG: flagellar motor switch protein FliN [Alphaproteobacteria bacterium]|nr:flagellar motor switch protein FliN [Alphaproteobacteria bacterium]